MGEVCPVTATPGRVTLPNVVYVWYHAHSRTKVVGCGSCICALHMNLHLVFGVRVLHMGRFSRAEPLLFKGLPFDRDVNDWRF